MYFKKYFILLFLLFSLFLTGCIVTDVEEYIESIPEVEEFLEDYPDADISYSLRTSDYLEDNLDDVHEECQPSLSFDNEYYRAYLEEENEEIIVWLEEENMETVCFVRETEDKEEELGDKDDDEDDVGCAFAGLSIYDAEFDERGKVMVSVANIGSKDFDEDVIVSVFDDYGNSVSRNIKDLSSGEVEEVLVNTDFDEEPVKVKVDSKECPDVIVISENIGNLND